MSRAPDGPEADQSSTGAEELTLRGAQEAVDRWISQFEEGYWPPLTNLARLIEEVGELAREMNHRFGHKPKKPDEGDRELAMELADVLFVLLVIANEQGIDLEEALRSVLAKYRSRDSDRWTRIDEAPAHRAGEGSGGAGRSDSEAPVDQAS